MLRKIVSGLALTTLLVGMLTVAFNIQQASPQSSEAPEIEWDWSYGGSNEDQARSVVQTGDGGYALVGWTDSFGAGLNDFWLVKTDMNGNMEWSQTYGGTSHDEARVLVATCDGGYAMIGTTGSYGAGSWDFWLVKTDMNGNMEWSQTYGGTRRDNPYDMIQTSDCGFAIVGQTDSFGVGQDDWWLVITDSEGNMIWSQTYGGTANDNPHSVVQTSDGGYAIAGNTVSFGAGDADFWVIKVDTNGNMIWNVTFGGPSYDSAREIIQTSDGGYTIVGFTESYGAGGRDWWLIKIDSEGNMKWDSIYGGPNDDNADDLVETCDGRYVVAGTRNWQTGNSDMWLVKFDSEGTVQWQLQYGGSKDDLTYSIVVTLDGGYAIAGFTESFGAGARDFWLIKLVPEKIHATINIDPDTLNLKSNGQWMTCYIELPEGYSVDEIEVSTILLNGEIGVDSEGPTQLGDHDLDGIPDLMVKFDRATVISWLGTTDYSEDSGKSVEVSFVITGKVAGTPFEGVDTIRVLLKN